MTLAAIVLSCALVSGPAAAEELVIPGSGNPEHVLGVLAREFNGRQGEHKVSVPPSTGIAGGIRDVLSGKAVLGRAGRPLTYEERSQGLAFIPLGRDAVVFVGGEGVTVRSITSVQATEAFEGKITDWRELGGKPGPIRAIGRGTGDASRKALMAHIRSFRDISYGPGVKVVLSDPQVIELLDRYGTALGFLNRSALFAACTKVVPLALDGVEPTAANVESGRYPVWLEFGLIRRADEVPGGAARAFLEFIASPEGAGILRAHNIIPAGAGAR